MLRKAEQERRTVTEALRKIQIPGPEARYDIEYSTATELRELTGVSCKFEGTHYWFWSPVLQRSFLRSNVRGNKVLDVGAGNGTLLKKLQSLGFLSHCMTGVDISGKATKRVREIGCQAVHGTISEVRGTFDTIFLSYFVDRDSDQRSTFEKSVELLHGRGVVVIEGLFPCILSDSSGVSYGNANVTRGESAQEDIQLVVKEFLRMGMMLQHRIAAERFVYSLDGPEVLPSHTLIFRKN